MLKFEVVTEEFVRDLLLSLKNSSPVYDEIPIQIYKEDFDLVGPLITKIGFDNLLLGKNPKELVIAKLK